MKKSNVILKAAIASALLAMAGSASAVTAVSATSIAYATEQFAGTGAINVFQGPAINVTAGTAIPSGGSVFTVALALTNGIWQSIPAVTSGASYSALIVGTLSATSSTLLVPITMNAGSSLGIGGNLLSIAAAAPVITSTGLATSGGAVTAAATVYQGTVTSANLATATVYEAAGTAATIATSTAGYTVAATANTSTSKIDLTATTPSVLFTNVTASATETASTTTFKLGRLTVTQNSAMQTDGTTAFLVGASAPAITATIAAPAGFFAAMGTTGLITLKEASSVTNACTGGVSATSVTNTVAGAASATAITVVGSALTAVTAGTPYDVCMTVNGTTAIVAGTPTIAATMGLTAVASPANKKTLAATNLQTLATNGQSYDVRNYVPAAATGYTTYVRVINTGSLSAAVSVALVDETTGTAGTAGVLGTLAAGAARNFTPAEIEAVTGAIAATARPRLRITAPTSGMNVQTFLVQPNGTVSDMTGAQ